MTEYTRLYRAEGRTCAAGPGGNDFTLCGDAEEGEAGEGTDRVIYGRNRGPITCERCCAVIQHVRETLKGVRLEPGPQRLDRGIMDSIRAADAAWAVVASLAEKETADD